MSQALADSFMAFFIVANFWLYVFLTAENEFVEKTSYKLFLVMMFISVFSFFS